MRDKAYNENKSIKIKEQVGFIKGIINDLYYLHDDKFDKKATKPEAELLYPIIDSVLSSAQMFANKNIKVAFEPTNDWNILVNINNVALRRSLLNLTTNAIESIAETGEVVISLVKNGLNAVIKIVDTGVGLSQENIAKLLNGKTESNKTNGKGLGFNFSKNVIEHFGGIIDIKSDLNKGTTQTITLPLLTQKPIWFIDKIDLTDYKNIVILDDNTGIHDVYRQKLNTGNLQHFFTVATFEKALPNLDKNTFFIIDNSLDVSTPSGLDLIKKYNLQNNSILITSMYLESKIKQKCTEFGVKLLPKSLIEYIIYILYN